ncbi:MAG: hypothetical protein IBX68_12815 [Dehalococcoidia bacterium]|nr:hypothetical protein [Dehalococcoidia bacterium]
MTETGDERGTNGGNLNRLLKERHEAYRLFEDPATRDIQSVGQSIEELGLTSRMLLHGVYSGLYASASSSTHGEFSTSDREYLRELGVHINMIQHRLEELEKRCSAVESTLPEVKITVIRDVSREQAEKDILDLFAMKEPLYYSDIAHELGLDLELVVDICGDLERRGEIHVIDDSL